MQHHTDHIQFAGDYKLDAIVLHNRQNEGIDPADQGIDITPLVIEMNIYEGIEKTSITGSLVIGYFLIGSVGSLVEALIGNDAVEEQ